MNRYPLWKNLLLVLLVVFGAIYALPNLFGKDPSIQVAHRTQPISQDDKTQLEELLKTQGIEAKSIVIKNDRVLARLNSLDDQRAVTDAAKTEFGRNYIVAQNLAPATPQWLANLNAKPMSLGLDLQGGVHFLMEIDMDAAMKGSLNNYVASLRGELRSEKIRYTGAQVVGEHIELLFKAENEREKAAEKIATDYIEFELKEREADDKFKLILQMTEQAVRNEKKLTLQQNIVTLRNRVNELGVAEPVIQQQGLDRIVVQLPGVQDTARAKEILGKSATLEYRLVDTTGGGITYARREGGNVSLKRSVIITGDRIIDAGTGIDTESGTPKVTVRLDSKGAKQMSRVTGKNIGKPMAVVFIENKIETVTQPDGTQEKKKTKIEEVINVATIRDQLGASFQTTGLDSMKEAADLALLLRAGALKAPMEIVEERTVGPSLGAENIEKGFNSVIIGFVMVLIFMLIYYRTFGIFANVALTVNLLLIIAVLSLMQATLTLPGIAGIVLTVGMAVDANVLIYERIREELRGGLPPQKAINQGYEQAVATIADANITTFIAAIVLFGFGSGPIKGFAVTLSIGLITSFITSIYITRALVNLTYGKKARLQKISIGGNNTSQETKA